ncbi:hypothetical protein M422DRAFT_69084 [Sphaerobolus stellatus SS14]|uniref:Uncharacterized protein n=1 Tax=Sphaerobolus stellatus (strain SS14) TaxID=990650 RepID=A0A0C9U680_SPHS4|nr:hypothetical protein M422DRAFT_69084 [Sphaerobolus stellatus SS14]
MFARTYYTLLSVIRVNNSKDTLLALSQEHRDTQNLKIPLPSARRARLAIIASDPSSEGEEPFKEHELELERSQSFSSANDPSQEDTHISTKMSSKDEIEYLQESLSPNKNSAVDQDANNSEALSSFFFTPMATFKSLDSVISDAPSMSPLMLPSPAIIKSPDDDPSMSPLMLPSPAIKCEFDTTSRNLKSEPSKSIFGHTTACPNSSSLPGSSSIPSDLSSPSGLQHNSFHILPPAFQSEDYMHLNSSSPSSSERKQSYQHHEGSVATPASALFHNASGDRYCSRVEGRPMRTPKHSDNPLHMHSPQPPAGRPLRRHRQASNSDHNVVHDSGDESTVNGIRLERLGGHWLSPLTQRERKNNRLQLLLIGSLWSSPPDQERGE